MSQVGIGKREIGYLDMKAITETNTLEIAILSMEW